MFICGGDDGTFIRINVYYLCHMGKQNSKRNGDRVYIYMASKIIPRFICA